MSELRSLLTRLVDASDALLTARTPQDVADTIVQGCAAVVVCDGAELRIFDRGHSALALVSGHGLRDTAGSPPGIPSGQGLCGHVFARGTPLATADYLDDPSFSHETDEWARGQGVVGAIAAPLMGADGRPLGTLAVFRRGGPPFEADDVTLVRELAATGAIAIRSARLSEVAQTAAEVIHTFNNLFAITLLRSEMLLDVEDEQNSERRRECLGSIRRAALEGREAVRRLRQARPSAVIPQS